MTAGDTLASWLRQAVTDIVTDRLGVPTEKERDIIDRRTEYSAKRWRIDYSACSRGRDASEIAARSAGGKLSDTECRVVAQRVTVTERHAALVEAVARAIMEVTPKGADPYDHRPAVITKIAGLVSRSATYDAFREAVIRFHELSATVHRYIEAETPADLTAPSVDTQSYVRPGALVLPILSDIRISVAATHERLRGCVAPRSEYCIGEPSILDTCWSVNDEGRHENTGGTTTGIEIGSPRLEPLLQDQAEPTWYPDPQGRGGIPASRGHEGGDGTITDDGAGTISGIQEAPEVGEKPLGRKPLFPLRNPAPLAKHTHRRRRLN
jgi:hypothetical protein